MNPSRIRETKEAVENQYLEPPPPQPAVIER
jgi:hypothetical protein